MGEGAICSAEEAVAWCHSAGLVNTSVHFVASDQNYVVIARRHCQLRPLWQGLPQFSSAEGIIIGVFYASR